MNMNFEKKALSVFRCLFFPPRCCACGAFLQQHILDTAPRALCESCRRKWEYAKLSTCGRCKEELSKCRCVPAVLTREGASVMLKMVEYDKTRDSVVRRCVIFMKRKNNRVVFDFFSEQLAGLLKNYLEETYTCEKSIFVTYVPRSLKNIRKSGVDQSELLAKGLACQLGCAFGTVFYRSNSSDREQKTLDKKQRLENVRNAFELEEQDFEYINKTYRCLVVVDDVVTTGSSLAMCVKQLKEKFYGRIICISLAQTPKE